MASPLQDALFQEILMARQRVYAVGQPTPLQEMAFPGVAARVFVKREDLGPINAYKWRGAYNRMAQLSADELARGVVAASAGNHAQGVARAACALGTHARIYMPRSTPMMKQSAVRRHGGEMVEVVLVGDSYDVAARAAQEFASAEQRCFIHPYDDLAVMGGQGTLADEVVMSGGAAGFTHAFVQIGGGGLAAATACWLKRYYPAIRVIGVEGVDQASMQAAFAAGCPVDLEYLDVFCDGTAVRRAGGLTFALCRELLDGIVTVTNDEVCSAIRRLWEAGRVIPETAGAMGLAGLLQQAGTLGPDARVLVILCGANMDFAQLSEVARRSGGFGSRRYFRFPIAEEKGSMLRLLAGLPPQLDIIDVQYGRTGSSMSHTVLGLQANPADFAAMAGYFSSLAIEAEEVDGQEDIGYRIIRFAPELLSHPLFVRIEFPERPGAFLGFMQRVADVANLCYFNYANSGERVGRALVGMESANPASRDELRRRLDAMVASQSPIRAWHEVKAPAMARILGEA